MRAPPEDAVRLGIVTVDYIAWLTGEAAEAAQQRFAILIEQDEAERLLSEARAPRPWKHPAPAFGLMMRDGGVEASWRRRAQAAMDELRLVLPKFLPIDLANTEFFDGMAAAVEQFEATTGEKLADEPLCDQKLGKRDTFLLIIYHSLLELQKLPGLVPRRRMKEWHRSVIELFRYYQAVVDPSCGASADGPAVRFIRLALERLGEGRVELKAIEQTLIRFRRAFPFGDPLALWVIPPTEDPPEPETPTIQS